VGPDLTFDYISMLINLLASKINSTLFSSRCNCVQKFLCYLIKLLVFRLARHQITDVLQNVIVA
jgi:hypothetical protein